MYFVLYPCYEPTTILSHIVRYPRAFLCTLVRRTLLHSATFEYT